MNNNNNRHSDGSQNRNRMPRTGQQQYYSGQGDGGQYQYRQVPPVQNLGYPPVRHKSRRQVRRAAGLLTFSAIILVLLIITVIIFASRCAAGFGAGANTDTKDTTTQDVGTSDSADTTPPVTEPPVTEPPETQLAATYEYVEKTAADVHKGYLLLVNYQNEYNFEGGFSIKPFYGNKNTSYKVRDTLVSFDTRAIGYCNDMMKAMEADMGTGDVLVNSSFRTYEEQEDVYELYLDKYGEEYVQLYVSMPGYSEHHTGLAVDFTVYTDDGKSYTFDEKSEYPEWLTANGHKYGFIQRYPSDKTDITKIAYENWHYRFVGKPHAFYMVKNNLCLEEYIDLLRTFEFGDKTLSITDDEGVAWQIYFVPADKSGITKVPVPKYAEYEISGNNVDGFIVTVKG